MRNDLLRVSRVACVEEWVLRNRKPRTMSGGEPSSIKWSSRCAARVPVLSRWLENRVGVTFDLEVYGLVLQSDAVLLFLNSRSDCKERCFAAIGFSIISERKAGRICIRRFIENGVRKPLMTCTDKSISRRCCDMKLKTVRSATLICSAALEERERPPAPKFWQRR